MKLSLREQRDRLKPRYQAAGKSHKSKQGVFLKMREIVLKDLRGSIRDRWKGRAA